MSEFALDKDKVNKNLRQLKGHLLEKSIPALYLSSFDTWLNEYVPLEDCLRYYVTGFTGSVAEALVLANGKTLLFVDGRYHQQADLQVDSENIEVVKVPYGVPLEEAILEMLSVKELKSLAIIPERTSYSLGKKLNALAELKFFSTQSIETMLQHQKPENLGTISEVEKAHYGEPTRDKLARIIEGQNSMYVGALDSLAWLANCRGYQLPYQSTFRGMGIATGDKLLCFVDRESLDSLPKLTNDSLEFFELSQFDEHLEAVSKTREMIYFEAATTNWGAYLKLVENFGSEKVLEKEGGLKTYHSVKNDSEIRAFEESFENSDRAIFNSLSWAKQMAFDKTPFSENDFYEKVGRNYKEEGAVCLSFKTISAFGENSSIIHFSTPSPQNQYQNGELVLLDSGAFYKSGMATDCTRTILPSGEANNKQKEIYTLVLKGLLRAQNAVFEPGTLGKVIDDIARSPITEAGHEYRHGTGHGIGVNVHEAGYAVTPTSEVPLHDGRVGSLEPGIYIPDFGGVRLENAVVVEKHPEQQGKLRFRSLVHIGFEHSLIDTSLLNDEEAKWLEEYEAQCELKGRSFKSV